MIRIAALGLCLLTLLSACGLRPLYGGAESPARQTLGAVEIGGIPGRAGYLMRGALAQRLGAAGNETPRYRLEVTLDDRIEGFGVRADNAVTRERRTLRARFQLVTIDRGTVLLDATAGSDAGVDVVSSEYATIAAEDSALERLTEQVADQIVARIALYATRRAEQQAGNPASEPAADAELP
ncbi:MAG: LPS assembly lipoprotein LptE [Pseudomonadota bacterium]